MLPNYEHLRQIIIRTDGNLEELKGKYSKSVRVAILQFITGSKQKKNEATFSKLITELKNYTSAPDELIGIELYEFIYERILNYNVREIQASKKMFIDALPIHNPNDKTFSRQEIETLQSNIHKITSNGAVMMLFNELLGVQSN